MHALAGARRRPHAGRRRPAWPRVLAVASGLGAAVLALPASAAPSASLGGWSAELREDGLFLESPGGRVGLHPQLRFQTRLSYPFDADPRTAEATERPGDTDLTLNRSRFKLGGHVGAPWVKFYTEIELRGRRLLDLRASLERWEALRVMAGQWKPEYNRERRDSSGNQQFVERSIVNREFTIDRQVGAMLSGRLGPQTRLDTSWWAGVFTGAGRGTSPDGGAPLWMTRLQWNPFGRVLPFSQSDVERRAEPAASVALAFAWNRSRYTRFSSDGGGQLDGFSKGRVDDQYEITQAVFETALHWRGFSFQQELHWKTVEDRVEGGIRRLVGGYAQAGWFPGERWSAVPSPLELALRVAALDPDTGHGDDARQELTVAANWFFRGHRNKLTLDGSWLRVDDPDGAADRFRVRLQWDVSF